MDAANVFRGARRFIANHDYILSNVFLFDWESDLFCITKSGYAIEIEVKVSRSDFFADFKKPKHELLKNAFQKKQFVMLYKRDAYFNKSTGRYYPTSCSFQYRKPCELTPNRFYFAVPHGMIEKSEVPPYAGLIYIDDCGRHIGGKPAPLIHKNKLQFDEKLLKKFYYRRNNALREVCLAINSVEWEINNKEDIIKKLNLIKTILE